MQKTLYLTILLVAIGAAAASAQQNRDPDAAALVFSDIELFWKAFDASGQGNRAEVLRTQYLQQGSVGLKEFLRVRIRSAENLAATIAKHPKYYASLRDPSSKLSASTDAIRAGFHKLKKIYEPAVFPNVYFVIGSMNSGGTITDTGLLIGVDMSGLNKNTPTEELGRWHKAVLKPTHEIPHIVAHELIHYQQKYPANDTTLLAMAIREGSADFIGELISGGMINTHLHAYGNPRERELWAEFRQEMNGTDLSKWLFQGDAAKDRPADLGYYMGYKICEAYYKRAADKQAAIRAMLEIKDFKEFLKASQYDRQFPGGVATAALSDGITLQTAPPVVVKTVPEAGSADVDPKLTEIKVTFSKEMKDGTWSWAIHTRESFPQLAGNPKYLADKRTCVLPVKLEPGKTYAIWINSGNNFVDFKDAGGRSAVPYLLVFKTK